MLNPGVARTYQTQQTEETTPGSLLHGQINVTTAGTREVLAPTTTCKSVTIKALPTNTGIIYVGGISVTSVNGFELSAGDTISLDIADLNSINLDASVSGEGVSYLGIA